jgi:hypothetical protein
VLWRPKAKRYFVANRYYHAILALSNEIFFQELKRPYSVIQKIILAEVDGTLKCYPLLYIQGLNLAVDE